MQQLVLKTSGLRDVLADALRGIKGVEVAFVFGSLAAGTAKAANDVDLFVIGDVGLRALSPALRRAAETIGCEINPVTMAAGESRKRQAKDAFVLDVLGTEKLFVKGKAIERRLSSLPKTPTAANVFFRKQLLRLLDESRLEGRELAVRRNGFPDRSNQFPPSRPCLRSLDRRISIRSSRKG